MVYLLACSRLRDRSKELKKREHGNKTAGNRYRLLFSELQLIFRSCLLLARHPNYLRAWNRIYTYGSSIRVLHSQHVHPNQNFPSIQ